MSELLLGVEDPRHTFGGFLAEVAARHGERRAVVGSGRSLTFRELESEARALARGLVGAGVVKGARVALLMANRPEWIVSAFAVGMLGGVLVPVSTFAGRDEQDHILRHSDASTLLMQPALKTHAFLDELLRAHPEIEAGTPGRLALPAAAEVESIPGGAPCLCRRNRATTPTRRQAT